MNMHRGSIPLRQYRCVIPANAARYVEQIELRKSAFDENDLRQIVRCAFGSWAAEEVTVEESSYATEAIQRSAGTLLQQERAA